MTQLWIGPDEALQPGMTGFLILRSNMERADRYELSDAPPYTNQSHAPRLYGWCGSWNNTSTFGKGAARVVKVARNGRALVERLEGEDLRAVLEELGYPELMPEEEEMTA